MNTIMKWLGLVWVADHERRIALERAINLDHVRRATKLTEQHRMEMLAERGSRVAAENEAARLRGQIVAINHAHGKSAAWAP